MELNFNALAEVQVAELIAKTDFKAVEAIIAESAASTSTA
jgi:hypothetical protein